MKRILIAEDDVFVRELVEAALNSEQYAVEIVSDGQAVVETLTSTGADLLILDISLPHLDGLSILKIVKQNSAIAHVPVIVFTNQDDAELKQAIADAGGFYAFKALTDMNALMKTVHSLLA